MPFETLADAAELSVLSLDDLTVLLLRLVLIFNYMTFAGRTFRQVIGTAMGTAMAPTYANLFLAGYEGPALKEFQDRLPFYGRFINDTHTRTCWISKSASFCLPFLDVHVSLETALNVLFRETQLAIVTRVYQKVMNAYLYIPWTSCHSDASKRSWIHNTFCKRLRARGYPGRWLRSVFDGVSYDDERLKALTPKPIPTANPADGEGDARLYVLKLTHNPIWDDVSFAPIWRPLHDGWIETGLGRAEDRFLASFKKPGSLGDALNKHNRDVINANQRESATTV
ncbi:hypothetical protein BDZ89DRAFT_1141693 [Hymenopellis radicata]|nr:hypothetical protein BDZ89DRAFT_1141693 [Hymenopellis radicata]